MKRLINQLAQAPNRFYPEQRWGRGSFKEIHKDQARGERRGLKDAAND